MLFLFIACEFQAYIFACTLPIQNSAVNGTSLLSTDYSLVPVPTKVCCIVGGVYVQSGIVCCMGGGCCMYCPVILHC